MAAAGVLFLTTSRTRVRLANLPASALLGGVKQVIGETSPEIVTRGFNVGEDGFMDGARQIVTGTLEQSSEEEKADYGVIKEKIRADLKRYISKQSQKRPLIMPVILEI